MCVPRPVQLASDPQQVTAMAVWQTHTVTPTVTVSVMKLIMEAQKTALSTEENAIGSVLLAVDPQHLIV